MSAYRTAIDDTTRIIDLRARYFRNLIVAVVTMSVLVVAGAIVLRSASALWAWLLLVPTCGLFFYLDARILNDWRKTALAAWTAHEIDFEVLRQSIRANPAMPKGTSEGMLATLPSSDNLAAEQKVLSPTRRAIAALSLAMHRDRADALLLQTAASAIVVCVLLAAIWMREWLPLSGISAIALLPAIRVWTARGQRAGLASELASCRAQAGFSEEDFVRIRAALH